MRSPSALLLHALPAHAGVCTPVCLCRWVRLFSYDTGEELECNKGHHGPVHAVRFAPTYDMPMYASGSEDGTIRMWPMAVPENGK